jgi:hypothetical protein
MRREGGGKSSNVPSPFKYIPPAPHNPFEFPVSAARLYNSRARGYDTISFKKIIERNPRPDFGPRHESRSS